MTFTDVLDQHSVPYRRHGESPHVTEGWIGIECPYCGKGTGKFGLGYNLAKRYCTCWKCGPHKTSEVLAELTGLPQWECWKLLGGLDFEVVREHKVGGKLVVPFETFPIETCVAHCDYLKRRGFKPKELAKLWRIQATRMTNTRSHSYAWRIYIPIFHRGEQVSWTTRTISSRRNVKYKAAEKGWEKMNHHDLLYGEDYAGQSVIVCEGPIDVWKIGPGAVATFGTSFSKQQVAKIAAYPVRAVCFDSEPEAQRRAKTLCDELAAFPGKTYKVRLDSGKDPGDADQEEILKIRSAFL